MLGHDQPRPPDAQRSLAEIERLMTLKRLRKVIETALTRTLTTRATGFLDLPECEQRREQEGVGPRGEDGTPGT
jgi:hypothetical protein